MEKINVAELLKDCPKGMELDCLLCNNPIELEDVVYNEVDSYPIRAVGKDGFHHVFTSYGASYNHNDAKCVIFPKGKTTWEGFIPLYKFKEGDVIFKRNFIAIIHLIEEEGKIWYHCWFNTKYENYKLKKDYGIGNINDGDEVRLATEEEKAKLFKVIKENGYTWNAEEKTLEELIKPIFKKGDKIVKKNDVYAPIQIAYVDNGFYYFNTESSVGMLPISDQDSYELVPNKFDINTLVPFESRVLVRDNKTDTWKPAYWGFYDETNITIFPYETVGGNCFSMCIPYNEDTKHLTGTTNDCDEFYKTWK